MPANSTEPLQKGGQLDRLLAGAEDIGGGRRRDEDQADREQHLVELAGPVEPAKQRPLEDDADDGRTEKGDGQRQQEGKAELAHDGDGDVAAEHAERASARG